MGAKARVQFTATGAEASPVVQNRGQELKLSEVFNRNRDDHKKVGKDVNSWLKSHGLKPIDTKDLDPDNPLLIGFTCKGSRFGGGAFGGELSREGTLTVMQGEYGKIVYLNYGSSSSDGGKSMDILWFTKDGGLENVLNFV